MKRYGKSFKHILNCYEILSSGKRITLITSDIKGYQSSFKRVTGFDLIAKERTDLTNAYDLSVKTQNE